VKIVITGTSSGVGNRLYHQLQQTSHTVIGLTRQDLDLSDTIQVSQYKIGYCDMLVNCAGTGVGGKIDLVNHQSEDVVTILNTNLLAPVLLSKTALLANQSCKIVNITSTNNQRYYANDLVYSLSKKALSEFGNMLRVEYPDVNLLEVELGLTRTNFNQNRYRKELHRSVDIYSNLHLTADSVAQSILAVLFDNKIKFINISP
jgi:short-subunit dehydrogenase